MSSVSPKHSTRYHSNSVDRSKLTISTSLPASLDADAGRMNRTNRLYSSSWIAVPTNDMSCWRNLQTNRRFGCRWRSASRSILLSIPTGFAQTNRLRKTGIFNREYVVRGDDEYAADTIHVNMCKEPRVAGVTVALTASMHLKGSPHTVSPSIPAQMRTLSQTRTKSAQTRRQSHSLKLTMCYTRAYL